MFLSGWQQHTATTQSLYWPCQVFQGLLSSTNDTTSPLAKTRRLRSLTEGERSACWGLWEQGLGFSDIARVLDSKSGSIFAILREHDGIAPRKPTRRKARISLQEREEISRGIAGCLSLREIARRLSRSPSTISREISRNGGRRKYRAMAADKEAWRNAKRPKESKLSRDSHLKQFVIAKLKTKWSPEQISGWLKRHHSDDPLRQVSQETIYRSLYIRSRKLLDHALMKNLRTSRRMRQSMRHSLKGDRGTIRIVGGQSIHDRPKSIEARQVSGHWEGDLITGSGNSHIATLVDRKSRYTMLVKPQGKDTVSVVSALTKVFNILPSNLKRSLTWDRGMELAKHTELSNSTGIPVYFYDPRSP